MDEFKNEELQAEEIRPEEMKNEEVEKNKLKSPEELFGQETKTEVNEVEHMAFKDACEDCICFKASQCPGKNSKCHAYIRSLVLLEEIANTKVEDNFDVEASMLEEGIGMQDTVQTPRPVYQATLNVSEPVTKKKNKKNIAFVAFSVIAIILIACFLTVGIRNTLNKRNVNSTDAGGDNTVLELEDSPETEIEYKDFDGEELTAAQIANKCKNSNVAILVYENKELSGQGSGILMSESEDGKYTYIVTCAHVIEGSKVTLSVQTVDGETIEAELVGSDTRTDIGVIKVKTSDLSDNAECAEFGNSEKLVVGDAVYAIGNPGGTEFFGSFTSGVVSDINRPVNSESGYTSVCIQHDAAINPGNSGGMLVNKYGQVIGINSQKIASTEYEGMGFAIPISVAKPIIDDLIESGYVQDRAKLGITYYPLSVSYSYYMVAQINGLPAGSVILNDVSGNPGFEEEGVKQYDIITEVNGEPLDDTDVLLSAVENGKPGDNLKLTIVRISEDYQITEFEANVPLIEDKGTTEETEEETTEDSQIFSSPWNSYSYNIPIY